MGTGFWGKLWFCILKAFNDPVKVEEPWNGHNVPTWNYRICRIRYFQKRIRNIFLWYWPCGVSTIFQAWQSEPFHLSADIESPHLWRSNMKGISPGNNVIFVSSYATENPTHTHKPESTVGHCPCFQQLSKKQKQKRLDFFTTILGFYIQRNAG